MSERQLQTAVFGFLRVALPQDAVAFAVPNGDGQMTLAPGALSGAPDLCVIYQGRAVFIELKTRTGAVRPSQRWVHDKLIAAGAVVSVCRSVKDVEDFLGQIVPLRASLQGAA